MAPLTAIKKELVERQLLLYQHYLKTMQNPGKRPGPDNAAIATHARCLTAYGSRFETASSIDVQSAGQKANAP